jgi:hypothetical protein
MLAGAGARALRGRGTWPGILLLVMAALWSSRLSHLAAHGPSRIAIDFVHLVLAATWTGGLLLFLHYLATRRPTGPDMRAVGLRFGTLALVCVAGVAATGLVSSLALLGSDLWDPAQAWSTPYRRFLAAKVGLTILMVGFAAVNRFRHLGPRPSDAASLARTLAWEAGTGVVVLVLAGFLTALSPPSGDDSDPGTVQADGDVYRVILGFSAPPTAGQTTDVEFRIVPLSEGPPVTSHTCAQGRTTCVEMVVVRGGQASAPDYPQPDGKGGWRLDGLLFVDGGHQELRISVFTGYSERDDVIVVPVHVRE